MIPERICVYAGSNPGRDPAYAELWRTRVARTAHDLDEVGALLLRPQELRYHRKSVSAFASSFGSPASTHSAAPPVRCSSW